MPTPLRWHFEKTQTIPRRDRHFQFAKRRPATLALDREFPSVPSPMLERDLPDAPEG